MDLQKLLKQKKEYLKILVEKFNQDQEIQNKRSQEILETNGAIKMLQKLINEGKEKGDK